MDLGPIPVLDQHAHNLLRPEAAGRYSYPAAFTEGHDPEVVARHARGTLFYRRSLRDVAQLLGCEPDEQAVLACRSGLGLEELAGRCFRAANIETVFLDDGYIPEETLPLEWHERLAPVRRLLRVEALAQDLLGQVDHFDSFVDRFRGELDPPPPNLVAFKSIAAYRSGLDVRPASRDAAEASFDTLRQTPRHAPPRLTVKSLIDFLVPHVLEVAAKHRIPVQFHTGFGDPDLDLRLANPLHLRPLLEDRRYRGAPVVLLHASYPYTREAGYLASVYPHVYLDTGLAVPFLSVAGMRAVVRMLLELAPVTKLMYSSDAHFIPELYYLAAKWGRKVLADVLEGAVHDSDLTAAEAEQAAALILRENARALYPIS